MMSESNKEKEIHLLDYLRGVWKRRFACAGIVLCITTGVIGYSFFIPDIYSAEASIMPIGGAGGGSSGGGLSSLSIAVPFIGSSAGGATNRFILFLRSRVLRERVVKALGLVSQNAKGQDLSDEQRLAAAADSLMGMVSVKNDLVYLDKIIINVESNSPGMATSIARQYLVELQNFISNNALTSAKRYRFFLETQLSKNKQELLEMKKMLGSFYRRNPVSEVQTIDVPIGINSQNEVKNFKNYEEFKNKFNVVHELNDSNDYAVEAQYVRNVPHQVYLKYLIMQQNILEQNSFALEQSYQAAKLEEAKQEPSFQILEEPVVPKYRIKPQRKSMARNALVSSVLIAILYALVAEFGPNVRRSALEALKEKDQTMAEVA